MKMEKTINCAECGMKYTYEPNPNYPDKRKYCANCSEKKKAQWAETTNGVDKAIDILMDEKPEIVKIDSKSETKGNGFHLTPEQCRSNALKSAIDWGKFSETIGDATVDILKLAKVYEKYIVTGE